MTASHGFRYIYTKDQIDISNIRFCYANASTQFDTVAKTIRYGIDSAAEFYSKCEGHIVFNVLHAATPKHRSLPRAGSTNMHAADIKSP